MAVYTGGSGPVQHLIDEGTGTAETLSRLNGLRVGKPGNLTHGVQHSIARGRAIFVLLDPARHTVSLNSEPEKEDGTAVKGQVLILYSDPRNCRIVEEVTTKWMMPTMVCSSLDEARVLLADPRIAVIFCEDRLCDGSYRDLLSLQAAYGRKIPVVIMIANENHDAVYKEAMELGAFDVVATPCSKSDVQWLVIRALQPGLGRSRSKFNPHNARP